MKFPELFKREKTPAATRDAQDRAERILAESFRLLSQVCTKMADFIEAQRLQRAGYGPQEKFLERLDENGRPVKKD